MSEKDKCPLCGNVLYKKYDCLGLDLLHLEMFRDEVIKKVISDLEDWNNSEGIHLGDAIDRLNNIIIEQEKAFSEEIKKRKKSFS